MNDLNILLVHYQTFVTDFRPTECLALESKRINRDLVCSKPLLIVILTCSKEELTLNSITLRIEACRGHITVLRGPISQVIRPALGVRSKGTTYLARHAKRRTAGIRR